MSTANVELVVGDVGSRHVVRDDGQTIRSAGTWSLLDVQTIQKRCRRDRIHCCSDRFSSYDCFFGDAGERQLEMQNRICARLDDDTLLCLLEVSQGDCNCVFAERHSTEVEFSAAIGLLVLYPIGMLCLQIDHCILNGTVLGIVNDAMYTPENLCICRCRSDCYRTHGENQSQCCNSQTHIVVQLSARFM